MKKWLYLAALLTAVILTRLPHPAVDIARLDPVRSIYIDIVGETLTIETDSGASGSGKTLLEACENLTANAHREIFLDTAEFLILHPGVGITEEFCHILRPTAKVVWSTERPDMEMIADYLSIHPPATTLAHLRPSGTRYEK